ncbi:MAG: glycosyltransferase family 39 protein [Candidatus Omnitrophica bacterium]|nr:glycosyltransferase family 39 protein [Candidatus Omnitrophota bacterium]
MIKISRFNLKPALVLLVIMIAGLLSRVYHLGFPSIGYHNMKENESLSIAQEMQRTGDYAVSRVYFHRGLEERPGELRTPRPPMVPYQILGAWKVFGENLWAPRLVNVVFGVLSILLICRLVLLITGSLQAGVWAAFFLATAPLGVFFSRNLQPESPAFFFMLLGSWLYARFMRRRRRRAYLISAGVSFIVSWLYAYNFLIGAVPFLFCLKLRSMKREAGLSSTVLSAAGPYLGLLAYVFVRTGRVSPGGAILRIWEPFTPAYWQQHGRAIAWYTTGENYTYVLLFLAACGIILGAVKLRGAVKRYLLGWCVSLVLYWMFFSEELRQNSFFQMPLLALLCSSAAVAAAFFVRESRKYFKHFAVPVCAAAIIGLSLPQAWRQVQRMHGTVFLGVDAAGETLKEFTSRDERVILFTYAQGYGIARYAHRYAGTPATLEELKEQEKRGVRFICFYPGDYFEMFKRRNPDMYAHIGQSYILREIGLMEHPDRLGYLILQKGVPRKPLGEMLREVRGRKEPRSVYNFQGNFIFFYTLRPAEVTGDTENESTHNQ